MMNIKEIIDGTLEMQYRQGQLYEDDKFRIGYLQAVDTLITQLNILLSVDDIEDLLDQEHDAVFYLNDKRLYRLDKVAEEKPFIAPLTPGYGGRKRVVEGSNLNGLFPGVMLSAPNFAPRW